MKRPLRRVVSLLAVLAMTPTALAVTAPPAQARGIGCGPVQHKVWDVKKAPNVTKSPNSPNWKVAARGPGTLTLSKSVSVSNSVTGTVGVPIKFVNAAVGFNAQKTWSTATSYSIRVPKKQTWVLRADAVHTAKTFKWKRWRNCNYPGGSWSKSGTGKALEFNHLKYRSYRKN